jgi:site-specific DNA recombinase
VDQRAGPSRIDAAPAEAAVGQLAENRQRSRQSARGQRSLRQRLVVCRQCGYAYHGQAVSLAPAKGQRRHYACYRCCGSDAYRFGGGGLCANQQVRTGRLDEAVWREVERVLEDPRWIAAEYERRLGLGRLIDGYAEGLIDKAEFAPRAAGLRQRLRGWEEQAVQIRNEAAQRAALSLIVRRLEDFARPVRQRRAVVDWSMQRDLIRLPVKHAEIDREQVTVMLRVTPTPAGPGADPGSPNPNIGHVLHHCGRSDLTLAQQSLPQRGRPDAGASTGGHMQWQGHRRRICEVC